MAWVRQWWSEGLTPSQQFSLVLLAVLLIGGTGLAAGAAWLIQRTVLGQTWVETVHGVEGHFSGIFGSDVFVQAAPEVHAYHADHGTGDGNYGADAANSTSPPLDMAHFDRVVRFHLKVYDIVHVRFFRSDGTIVYSYRPEEIGQSITTLLPAEATARSLRGETVTDATSLLTTHAPDGQVHADVMSFYIPVLRDNQVVGAAWLQRDVTQLIGSVRQAQAVLVWIIFGVVALLFVALRQVYGDSTRKVRSQATALQRAYGELSETYDATLRALTTALDSRDHETGGHAQRVTRLAVRLGEELGLSGEDLTELELGAMLHDIGKIGVPDAILNKPGPLSEDDWEAMRRHPMLGVEMLAGVPFLSAAMPLIRHHHERWDGKGYPDGLAGEAIPLGARIFAVADSFDAMTSRRPYRQPLTLRDARAELARCAGGQFDPVVVAACERLSDAELLALMETPVLGKDSSVERAA
jgi:HD-GYP domain-containing protein (c-di-GMP phosphodiesterase class II)